MESYLKFGNRVFLGLISALIITLPSYGAQKLYFVYGGLNLSLKIESLELFAKEGKINSDLQFYLRDATEEQKNKFREALVTPIKLSPLLVWQFFNDPMAEDFLFRIGKAINIQGGGNGKYALRAAFVNSSFDPQGITLLNVLKNFPTNIQLDLELILKASKLAEKIIQASWEMTQEMKQLSAQQTATDPPVNFAELTDLSKPGPYQVIKQRWELTDTQRNRSFYVDVYKPETWREGKTPVVIFSHGLASNPESFVDRSQHLASYGYVVALPQHPGSDGQQAEALKTGYSDQIFLINEFIDRPKDITFLIDELQRRNQSEFEGRLNLDAVGVGGHSFGGYTALAIAGAEIDFDYLEKVCPRPFATFDIALFLQCRALDLPREAYNFRDPRVKAVWAGNAVNHVIFGPNGLSKIDIPVFLSAGTNDPATPALFEQMLSFPKLKTPNKYLGLAEGQAHVDFSQLDGHITESLNTVTHLTLASPELIHRYIRGMQTAFFDVHIADNLEHRPYLSSAYAAYLSQNQPFEAYVIDGRMSKTLEEALPIIMTNEGIKFKDE